jgi:hypothetical protein
MTDYRVGGDVMALFKSTPRSDCVSEIQEAMVETGPAANASIQGTVARSGQVLLLMLEAGAQDPARRAL